MTPIQIRPAYISDYLPIAQLWQQLDLLHAKIHPELFSCPPNTLRPREYLQQELKRPHQAILVAEQENVLVGVITIKLYDTPVSPFMVQSRRAYVEDLVVDQAQQRQGIGRQLMKEAAAWARKQGATQILLTVWTGNNDAEIFYHRLGYQPVNQVLGFLL